MQIPLSDFSQQINQIHFDSPAVDLLLLQNHEIKNNTIKISDQMRGKIIQPSMYESWTEPEKQHIKIQYSEIPFTQQDPQQNLMIFDTWGTSSYYHLLIDHIIPLWITRELISEKCGLTLIDTDYLRVSNNGYPRELKNIQEIFEYFMGSKFEENINGAYKNIIYGYCFRYRPYLGPNFPVITYKNTKKWLNIFRATFSKIQINHTNPILVPLRLTRQNPWVDRFLQKYSHRFNFVLVDLANLTISEQIDLAGQAWGMFGNEGAGFANIVFMRQNSTIVPVGAEAYRFLFHERLAHYCDQRFHPIQIYQDGTTSIKEYDLLRIFEN